MIVREWNGVRIKGSNKAICISGRIFLFECVEFQASGIEALSFVSGNIRLNEGDVFQGAKPDFQIERPKICILGFLNSDHDANHLGLEASKPTEVLVEECDCKACRETRKREQKFFHDVF